MEKTTSKTSTDFEEKRGFGYFTKIILSLPSAPIIKIINIDNINIDPQKERSIKGIIPELIASLTEKEILEPIIIRSRKGSKYEIIAGERRYVAAKKIGLKVVPCIEMDVEDNEALELALIENLQRKDLDVLEEADGISALIEIYGYTNKVISQKIKMSREKIYSILKISQIPKRIKELCTIIKIKKSDLIELSKLKKERDMEKFILELLQKELKRKHKIINKIDSNLEQISLSLKRI